MRRTAEVHSEEDSVRIGDDCPQLLLLNVPMFMPQYGSSAQKTPERPYATEKNADPTLLQQREISSSRKAMFGTSSKREHCIHSCG